MADKVLVVGSYNQDHAWQLQQFPAAGETVLGGAFLTGPGGKGFNQATSAALQGATTVFIGARGEDLPGQQAQAHARKTGIHCHWQVESDHATGTAAILLGEDGQNRIIVAAAANQYLSSAFVTAQDQAFADAGVLLLQLETSLEAVDAALKMAAQHDLLRILNPAPFHEALGTARLQQCDLITPNENEFSQMLSHLGADSPAPDEVAALADAEIRTLCAKLPVACVIITLGESGCLVCHNRPHPRLQDAQEVYRVAAADARAIDTTGAGDAFNGALAAARVRWPNAPLASCVVHAGRAAAMATEHRGAAAAMVDHTAVTTRYGLPSGV